jgi:L-cysteine:1D-myo-inositol 2-amino-2-deoxy-alpha-D-glucopyranoside ligase
MVRYEGEKMSKSLGNLVMVRELLKDWSPDALRLYLANHHYRESWGHDMNELQRADGLAETLRSAALAEGKGGVEVVDAQPYRASFIEAMDDDLNSPTALTHLANLAEAILEGARRGRQVSAAQDTLRALARVFGLRLDAENPETSVTETWRRYLKDFT